MLLNVHILMYLWWKYYTLSCLQSLKHCESMWLMWQCHHFHVTPQLRQRQLVSGGKEGWLLAHSLNHATWRHLGEEGRLGGTDFGEGVWVEVVLCSLDTSEGTARPLCCWPSILSNRQCSASRKTSAGCCMWSANKRNSDGNRRKTFEHNRPKIKICHAGIDGSCF